MFEFHFRRVKGATQNTCYKKGVLGVVGCELLF